MTVDTAPIVIAGRLSTGTELGDLRRSGYAGAQYAQSAGGRHERRKQRLPSAEHPIDLCQIGADTAHPPTVSCRHQR